MASSTDIGSVGDSVDLLANCYMCKRICLNDIGAGTHRQLAQPVHADTHGSGTTRAHISRNNTAEGRGKIFINKRSIHPDVVFMHRPLV